MTVVIPSMVVMSGYVSCFRYFGIRIIKEGRGVKSGTRRLLNQVIEPARG